MYNDMYALFALSVFPFSPFLKSAYTLYNARIFNLYVFISIDLFTYRICSYMCIH